MISGTVTDKMLDYLGRLIHPSDEQTSEFIRAALHSSPGDYQPVAVAGALIEPVFASELPTPKASPFIKCNTNRKHCVFVLIRYGCHSSYLFH